MAMFILFVLCVVIPACVIGVIIFKRLEDRGAVHARGKQEIENLPPLLKEACVLLEEILSTGVFPETVIFSNREIDFTDLKITLAVTAGMIEVCDPSGKRFNHSYFTSAQSEYIAKLVYDVRNLKDEATFAETRRRLIAEFNSAFERKEEAAEEKQ